MNAQLANHEFCDSCPGCRPALVDVLTGKPLPDDSPIMLKVNKVWNSHTTYEERKAFIAVTLHNSRKADDMFHAHSVITKMEQTLGEPDEK